MHYELMREMGWSWTDLKRTPLYVQRYCWDISQRRIAAEVRRSNNGKPSR
jgi:hypothetical protein